MSGISRMVAEWLIRSYRSGSRRSRRPAAWRLDAQTNSTHRVPGSVRMTIAVAPVSSMSRRAPLEAAVEPMLLQICRHDERSARVGPQRLGVQPLEAEHPGAGLRERHGRDARPAARADPSPAPSIRARGEHGPEARSRTVRNRVEELLKRHESSRELGFEAFERELHALFTHAECAATHEALERHDVDLPYVFIDGQKYRRVYRGEKDYLCCERTWGGSSPTGPARSACRSTARPPTPAPRVSLGPASPSPRYPTSSSSATS